MSPKQLSEKFGALPRWQRSALNISAVVGAIVAVLGAISPIAKPGVKAGIVTVLDSTYVLQQSYTTDTLKAGARHAMEVDSIFRMIREGKEQRAQIDSLLRCLTRKRKPAWCDE